MLKMSCRGKTSRRDAETQRAIPLLLCVSAPLREAFLLAISLACFSSALAQTSVSFAPPEDATDDFQATILLEGLANPTAVALRPTQANRGPYELYVAESGAGQVIRVSTDSPEKVEKVIVGFSAGTMGFVTEEGQAEYVVGPIGLTFISRTKLVVAAKGISPRADTLASYSLPSDGAVLSADEKDHAIGPLKEKIASQVDDLQFAGLAMAERICFVTSGGVDSQGWILKAGVVANRLAYLQPFIELKKVVGFGGPAGIAIIPKPRPPFLVVSLMGSRTVPHDSRLAYFVSSTGELAMNLPTGLHDIISLAYSPSGQLYAADFSWHDEQAGGVFRIDDARVDGRQTCRAVKIASIVRPFGLAFTPDGTLFVTAFGAGENAKQGTLIKISGDF